MPDGLLYLTKKSWKGNTADTQGDSGEMDKYLVGRSVV